MSAIGGDLTAEVGTFVQTCSIGRIVGVEACKSEVDAGVKDAERVPQKSGGLKVQTKAFERVECGGACRDGT